MFTAEDSRRGTLGQLAGGTVEVQVTDDLVTFSTRASASAAGRRRRLEQCLQLRMRIFIPEGAEHAKKRYVDRAGVAAGSVATSRRTFFTSSTMTMMTANQMQ
jgi:hypothetical protein